MTVWTSEINELKLLYESLRIHCPESGKELEKLIRTEDPIVIMLYSRRCLEVIVTKLCENELKRPRKTEPLKGIIDKLNKEDKVPSHIITSMHGINDLSTYGAHPKDFDPEQVRPVLSQLNIILKWYIQYITRITSESDVEKEQQESVKAPVGIFKTGAEQISEKPSASSIRKLLTGVLILTGALIVLLLYNKIFGPDSPGRLRSAGGKISIAIMPFKNLTSDTLLNIWQPGLQSLLITSLSNSEELSVRQYETIDNILGNPKKVDNAALTPSFAADIASRLDAKTVILGSLYKAGERIRVTVNLMNSRTEEIYKSYNVDGKNEDDFFTISDSLSKLIRNGLEIKRLEEKNDGADLKNIYTSSADALKYYIQARSNHGQLKYELAIDLYLKSISADTNFVSPMLMLAYVYGDLGNSPESRKWAYKAYERIYRVPQDIQLQIREVKSAVDKDPMELINNIRQYLEINPYSTRSLYTMGWAYFNTEQWQSAIDAFEESIKLNKKFGNNYKLWVWNYLLLGNAYHKTGKHKKEMKIYEDCLRLWPGEESSITFWQAVCFLSRGDTVMAGRYLNKIKTIGYEKGWPESEILSTIAGVYEKAGLIPEGEKLNRGALALDPQNKTLIYYLAYLLIKYDINVNEGTELAGKLIEEEADKPDYLFIYGWGLFKQGKTGEALKFLEESWKLKAWYDHEHFKVLEAAKKTI